MPIEGKIRVVITDSLLTPVGFDGTTRLGDNEGDDYPYFWITRDDDPSLDPHAWTETLSVPFKPPLLAWLDSIPKWLQPLVDQMLQRSLQYEVLVENKPPLTGDGLVESDIWFRKIVYNPEYDPEDPDSLNIVPNPDGQSGIFKKIVSMTPLLASNKAKLNIMPAYGRINSARLAGCNIN